MEYNKLPTPGQIWEDLSECLVDFVGAIEWIAVVTDDIIRLTADMDHGLRRAVRESGWGWTEDEPQVNGGRRLLGLREIVLVLIVCGNANDGLLPDKGVEMSCHWDLHLSDKISE